MKQETRNRLGTLIAIAIIFMVLHYAVKLGAWVFGCTYDHVAGIASLLGIALLMVTIGSIVEPEDGPPA